MRRKLLPKLLLALLLFGASCQDKESSTLSGELQLLGLIVDSTVQGDSQSYPDNYAVWRCHIFSIDIVDITSGEVINHYPSNMDIPPTITLPAGAYQIRAYTADVNQQVPENGHFGFDQPQYAASENFTIIAGSFTPLTLTATLKTTSVTVNYSDGFDSIEDNYYVTVMSSQGAEITFNSSEKRTAHLLNTDNSIELQYQLHIGNGTKATRSNQPLRAINELLLPAYHYTIDINTPQELKSMIK